MQNVTRISGLLLFFYFCISVSYAQFYSTGQSPASIKWKQIRSENFQIIFPEENEFTAQKVANILEFNYKKVSNTLNHEPEKISVIIHSQSIRSNGYVSWAPKRMELFTTPAQNMYPGDWLNHLCIHELRHVVQIDKLNQGVTKILSLIFGQQATGLVAGQMPMWFYEGDAVATETVLSSFGRGRLPYFQRGIRTILMDEKKEFSFDKILFGSYKDYVPDYYEYGYQFTAYVRSKYGAETWSKVVNHVAKNSYTLLPTNLAFNQGLKKHTGLSHKKLYHTSFSFLDSLWKAESQNTKNTPTNIVSPDKTDYTHYLNPQILDDNRIVAFKKGFSHIPRFVEISKGKEKVLLEPGPLISEDFSVSGKFIVWAEYRPDARWHNREFTAVKMFNIETQEERLVVDKVRYFSPDLSANANKIAVIEVTPANKYFLNIISSYNGFVAQKIASPNGNFIQRPKWAYDERYIYVVEINGNQKQVSRYDLVEEQWETIFAIPGVDIQRIYPDKDYIFFHSTYNGVDNIYAFSFANKLFYQLTNSKYGITDFCLSANGQYIFASEYNSQGFDISKIPVERALWHKKEMKDYTKNYLAEKLTSQESEKVEFADIPKKEYTVNSYSRLANLFYFHSWAPFYIDYEEFDFQDIFAEPYYINDIIYPGLMILSQNKLSTMESVIGYAYKNNHHFVSSSLIYKGWYPYIKITADYGDKHQYFAASDADWVPSLNYDNSNFSIETYIPFNLSRGKYHAGFYPGISLEYSNRYYHHYLENYYQRGLEFMNFQAYLYYYTRKAHRDIQPRAGLIIDYNLYNTPFDHDFFGYISTIDSRIFLPGFYKNHGFKLDVGYQYQSPQLYLYSSRFTFPRGIERSRTEKLFKIYGDYVFPLAYPDWSLGPLAYFKRIRSSLFYDLAINQYSYYGQNSAVVHTQKDYLSSFGIEFTFDYHLLRTMFPLNSGVRIGYIPGRSNVFAELIFGIDFYQF
ncbi:MAG: hypothetical protein ACLFVR_03545 [Thiohalospira sp.]